MDYHNGINFKKDLNTLTKILSSFPKINNLFFNKTYQLNNINSAIKDFEKGVVIRPLIKF